MTSIRLLSFTGLLTAALLCGCASSSDPDGGVANPGLIATLEMEPMVTIDDESGTDVRVFVRFDYFGGPDVETLEVVSAGLRLDREPYADLELAIPADHPPFPGIVDGETLEFELRGTLPDDHDDWGLCLDPQGTEVDELRVSLDLTLRVTPGANDADDELEFEAHAVTLICSYTG
jgi:hypothetical protein